MNEMEAVRDKVVKRLFDEHLLFTGEVAPFEAGFAAGYKDGHEEGYQKGRTEFAMRQILRTIKTRCTNPKSDNYRNYGARGIECRIANYEEFFAAVGPRPSDRHTIDRIDNDGHYEAGNLRWATWEEQRQNTRTTKRITTDGVTRSIREWSKITGISYNTVMDRRARGWCDQCSILAPRRQPCPHRQPKPENKGAGGTDR